MVVRENFTFSELEQWLNERRVTEIECLVPKLDIHVSGPGGSRRAGEQAAAKLALEAVQAALAKAPAAGRKSRPRTTQLKLAGIATIQPDAPVEDPPTHTKTA